MVEYMIDDLADTLKISFPAVARRYMDLASGILPVFSFWQLRTNFAT